MEDAIITFMKEYGVIAAFAVTMFILYRHMSKDMRERFDDMRKDMNDRFDRVESSVKEVKSELTEKINRLERNTREDNQSLRDDIRALTVRVDVLYKKGGATSAMESNSPLVLTEMGLRIVELINARAMAEKYADQVEIPENATRYRIQEACFRFATDKLESLLNEQEKELIEDSLFEEGESSLGTVYTVIGVVLRDYLLEKRGFDVPVRKAKGEQTPPPQQQQQSHPPA